MCCAALSQSLNSVNASVRPDSIKLRSVQDRHAVAKLGARQDFRVTSVSEKPKLGSYGGPRQPAVETMETCGCSPKQDVPQSRQTGSLTRCCQTRSRVAMPTGRFREASETDFVESPKLERIAAEQAPVVVVAKNENGSCTLERLELSATFTRKI